MATIISPTGEEIPKIHIETDFSFSFGIKLESNETLVSWKIEAVDPIEVNKGIIIGNNNTIKGSYHNPFIIKPDALGYRKQDKLYYTDEWEALPPGRNVDMFRWHAPPVLLKIYKYLVTATILIEESEPETGGGSSRISSGGGTGGSKTEIVTGVYSQRVYGTWTKWQQLLKKQIKERKGWQD